MRGMPAPAAGGAASGSMRYLSGPVLICEASSRVELLGFNS